jgi:DNA-binding MarR family transcriptional regulator
MPNADTPPGAAARYAALFPAIYLRFHRRDEKARALSGAARAVMLHLAQSGPLTIGECARHFQRAQSATSELVKQLEKKGLLARVRDGDDGRRTLIWLSELGRARMSEESEVLSRALLVRALAKMKPAEREMLLAGTQALVDAAERGPTNHRTRNQR